MPTSIAVTTFKVDVTPPVGHWICGGLLEEAHQIHTKLWLRGVVLSANQTRYLIASIDFCELVGPSHQRLKAALAAGAGIPLEQVTVHSTHVHDAPLIHEQCHETLQHYQPAS